MNEKELRAILALKGLSLMVVRKKTAWYRFNNPQLGDQHFNHKSVRVETGWMAYTVPLSKNPKRLHYQEEDELYGWQRLKRHRKDAIRKYVQRMFFTSTP